MVFPLTEETSKVYNNTNPTSHNIGNPTNPLPTVNRPSWFLSPRASKENIDPRQGQWKKTMISPGYQLPPLFPSRGCKDIQFPPAMGEYNIGPLSTGFDCLRSHAGVRTKTSNYATQGSTSPSSSLIAERSKSYARKGAIEKVPTLQRGQGLYSHFF